MNQNTSEEKLKRYQGDNTTAAADNGDDEDKGRLESRIGELEETSTIISFDENLRDSLMQGCGNSSHFHYKISHFSRYKKPKTADSCYLNAFKNCFSVFASPHVREEVNITEIVRKNDSRAKSAPMRTSISSDFQHLLERDTFKVILKEKLPNGSYVLTALFVHAIESNAEGKVKYKARYVISRHRDSMKRY